jgi:hypothetical protein
MYAASKYGNCDLLFRERALFAVPGIMVLVQDPNRPKTLQTEPKKGSACDGFIDDLFVLYSVRESSFNYIYTLLLQNL